jgi:anti-sigma factor RsiW
VGAVMVTIDPAALVQIARRVRALLDALLADVPEHRRGPRSSRRERSWTTPSPVGSGSASAPMPSWPTAKASGCHGASPPPGATGEALARRAGSPGSHPVGMTPDPRSSP